MIIVYYWNLSNTLRPHLPTSWLVEIPNLEALPRKEILISEVPCAGCFHLPLHIYVQFLCPILQLGTLSLYAPHSQAPQ